MRRFLAATLLVCASIAFFVVMHSASSSEHAEAARPAIDPAELDPQVRPQDDFWRFVNGKWHARTEIPADEARWGSFSELRDKAREDVRIIIDDLSRRTDLSTGSPG
jgi:putative endopeptidase